MNKFQMNSDTDVQNINKAEYVICNTENNRF